MNARALAAVSAALLLAACAGEGKPKSDPPMTLSYRSNDAAGTGGTFQGYQQVVQATAPSYVRVIIKAKEGGADKDASSNIVNGASGVIVDPSGLVITAAHIALDTKLDAQIITIDGKYHKAAIVRVDRNRELALIRMAPFPGIQAAPLADSSKLTVGEPVFAIGTPANKPGVVSLGQVVETKHAERLDYNGFGFDDAVKLRIEVDPGNSGGPVYDRQGRLIGIIAAFVLGNTDAAKNYKLSYLAYAVPSNAIRAYMGNR